MEQGRMTAFLIRAALGGSGTILGLIGGALLIAPDAFLAMSHVYVEPEPGLMSELAAPGGTLLFTGALMLLGAARQRFADLTLLAGGTVYGSYGLARAVSLVLHGWPSGSLIAAMVVELAVAGSLFMLAFAGRRSSAPIVSAAITGVPGHEL
jgi:hypothetical protein